MDNMGLSPTAMVVLAGIMVVAALFLFFKPLKLVFKILINASMGFILLAIISIFGKYIGVTLAITPFSSAVSLLLGLPGVALLLFLKLLGI